MFSSTSLSKAAATLLLLASAVHADLLSVNCTTALQDLVRSPEAASCLNTTPLLTLELEGSIVPDLESWLTGLCVGPVCSDAVLETFARTAAAACSVEFDVKEGMEDAFVGFVTSEYRTAKEIACLTNESTEDLCTLELIKTVEGASGPLSFDALVSGSFLAPFERNITTYSNAFCTFCVKRQLNVLRGSHLARIFPEDLDQQVSSLCGPGFVDGTAPQAVVDPTTNSNGTSGAAAFVAPLGVAFFGVTLSAWMTL